MNNKNGLIEKVSKTAFVIGLLIEIFLCLVGFLLQAVLIDLGFKCFYFVIYGIMIVYLVGRNYFFNSASSAVLGIQWPKTKFVLLKNIIYLSALIFLFVIKTIFIKIIIGLAINCDIAFMAIKGNWFLDKCFKIESYRIIKFKKKKKKKIHSSHK